MTSKGTKFILKYFKFNLSLSSLFFLSFNFKKHTVKVSNLRCFAFVTFSFYYFGLVLIRFVDLEAYVEKFYHQKNSVVFINTMFVENIASMLTVMLVTHQQFVKRQKNQEFFTLLMRSFKASELNYELFDDSLGWQMTVIAFIADFGLFYLTSTHIYNGSNGGGNLVSLNPYKNIIMMSICHALQYEIVTRFSIALSFFVDLMRKIVMKLNFSLEEALKKIENLHDSDECISVIRQTCQWYSTVLRLKRSYEENFAFIILVFQCISFLIGLNQARIIHSELNNHKQFISFHSAISHFQGHFIRRISSY